MQTAAAVAMGSMAPGVRRLSGRMGCANASAGSSAKAHTPARQKSRMGMPVAQHARHALVADRMPGHAHGDGDLPQAGTLCTQAAHGADRRLLSEDFGE